MKLRRGRYGISSNITVLGEAEGEQRQIISFKNFTLVVKFAGGTGLFGLVDYERLGIEEGGVSGAILYVSTEEIERVSEGGWCSGCTRGEGDGDGRR